MDDVIETRWHWGWDCKPPDATGSHSLRVECGYSILSMSIRGFDAMPDDTLIGFWLADNFDGAPEEQAPVDPMTPVRLKLQALMDGPMVGSGIGSR